MTQAYLEDFTAFAANGGAAGPAWVPSVRRSAIDRFAALGFPTPKNEDWHFTSVAPIAEREFRAGPADSSLVQPADLAPFIFNRPEWPTLVFVNGRFASELSTLSTLPRGVAVRSLAQAWEQDEPLLARYLTKLATYEEQAFTALNTAFMKDGAFVHIPADVSVELPIHLLFVADANAAKSVLHPRSLIVADRHSKATVIESYVALGDAGYFTNTVTEAVVEEGATLTHYKLQRESERAYHVGTVDVRQGRDSHFISFSFATGAALSRTNIYTVLDGPGCGATLNGLYIVGDEQHVDHQTRIEHAQPNCFSRELYKGILDGASHGVFNGKVYVHPIAQQTDGKQSNNNLLLSDKARVDTKPQLEIFADDVKCTHGATVGRIDEQALFYMKSRGVSAELARQLLTYAFAADVLEELEVTEVRDELERLTLARFTSGAGE
ncbi:MAG TPA: Fe-S cluster assembly protein SufD [Gemmatimonadaceae bacterium]|nr:Fe-S cluster assembly protein SufD [Gemmatimonadaceae bacterium]